MNKHVVKPKRKVPLVPDSNLSQAKIDKYLRAHHDEVSAKLKVGKAALDRGDAVEVKSLESLLAGIHKRTRRTR